MSGLGCERQGSCGCSSLAFGQGSCLLRLAGSYMAVNCKFKARARRAV